MDTNKYIFCHDLDWRKGCTQQATVKNSSLKPAINRLSRQISSLIFRDIPANDIQRLFEADRKHRYQKASQAISDAFREVNPKKTDAVLFSFQKGKRGPLPKIFKIDEQEHISESNWTGTSHYISTIHSHTI